MSIVLTNSFAHAAKKGRVSLYDLAKNAAQNNDQELFDEIMIQQALVADQVKTAFSQASDRGAVQPDIIDTYDGIDPIGHIIRHHHKNRQAIDFVRELETSRIKAWQGVTTTDSGRSTIEKTSPRTTRPGIIPQA